jgi:hypothetical protein
MKRVRGKFVVAIGTAVLALMIAGAVAAAVKNATGVLGCAGASIELVGGTEGNRVYTIYQFTHFNDTAAISIDRMVVPTADGNATCDFPGVEAFADCHRVERASPEDLTTAARVVDRSLPVD